MLDGYLHPTLNSLTTSDVLLISLTSIINRRQVTLCRSHNTNTLSRKSTAMNGAIETLLSSIPAHDTLHVRTQSAVLLDITLFVLVHRNGLGSDLTRLVYACNQ